jgi:hypothetical protein
VSAGWHDHQRQWVAVHVTDTGIGIPKHKLGSIFLPFTQVDGSISRQYGGFGLGLSITQELVKAHGGELWVRSREHKGSQFTFTLPSFTGQQPAPQQQQQQLQGAAPPAVNGSSGLRWRRNSAAPRLGLTDEEQRLLASGGAAAGRAVTGDAFAGSADEEFTRELPYDAAQLAALASCKPFAPPQQQQPSGVARTSSGGAGLDSRLLPASLDVPASSLARDPRPSQFACTGRYRVLSVDDDAVNQTVVQSLLASTGYEVVCLYNGQQTLDYIASASVLPDLILLDVLMPDMTG